MGNCLPFRYNYHLKPPLRSINCYHMCVTSCVFTYMLKVLRDRNTHPFIIIKMAEDKPELKLKYISASKTYNWVSCNNNKAQVYGIIWISVRLYYR